MSAEQRRERFEEWVVTELLQGKNTAEQIKAMRDGDDYSSHSRYTAGVLTAAWKGYNAALDGVEVNLPSPQDDGVSGQGYKKGLLDCRAAIEAAGLKVKP